MNELVLDGKTYISSKRASEITRYTKDYVGQLARAGKISARLVGRNWYVDEASLLEHAGLSVSEEKQSASKPAEAVPVSLIEEAGAEEEIQSYQSTHPLRELLKQQDPIPTRTVLEVEKKDWQKTWEPVTYVADSHDLLPKLAKMPPTLSTQTLEEEVKELKEGIAAREHDAEVIALKKIHIAESPLKEESRERDTRPVDIVRTKSQISTDRKAQAQKSKAGLWWPYASVGVAAVFVILGLGYLGLGVGSAKTAADPSMQGKVSKASALSPFLQRSFDYERVN